MEKRRKGERGFTLVELLVVIAIIGVLATLVLLQLGTARARARDTKRIADVAQFRSAIEQYYEDNQGDYPADITTALIGQYFSSGEVPADPLANAFFSYEYCVSTDLQQYQVSAELEQKAAALNADSDLVAADIVGGVGCRDGDGDQAGVPAGTPNETCASATLEDCVYDQGTK